MRGNDGATQRVQVVPGNISMQLPILQDHFPRYCGIVLLQRLTHDGHASW